MRARHVRVHLHVTDGEEMRNREYTWIANVTFSEDRHEDLVNPTEDEVKAALDRLAASLDLYDNRRK